MLLADMGADVIKLEMVGGGDDIRRSVPPVYGQHTREVLVEHGFEHAEADRLAAEGAIMLGDLTTSEAAQ